MTKEEFVKKLSEFCEFENKNFNLGTNIKSIDEYDSFALMSIIAFVDATFKINLAAADLKEMSDFNSLIEIIGKEKFDND